MEEDWSFNYALESLRIQRHDFMNYLQVILGYIQINKNTNATEYIRRINKVMGILSAIFNLDSPVFALLFQDFSLRLIRGGLDIEFYSEIDKLPRDFLKSNIDITRDIIISLSDEIVNEKSKSADNNREIHIELFEDIDRIKLLITGSINIGNLIEGNLIEPKNHRTGIIDIKKYIYGKEFGYLLSI